MKIKLELDIDVVNAILDVLANAPYAKVSNIIPLIIEQGRPQAEEFEAGQKVQDVIEKVQAEPVEGS